MRRTAELAERLDVRLHTHLAEDPDEDAFCLETYGCRPIELFEDVGWGSGRSWVAHCIYPNPAEIARMGGWGTGVAHCPSSNMMIGGGGIAPVTDLPGGRGPGGPGLRRVGIHRLRVAVAGGPGCAAARAPAGRAHGVHGAATRLEVATRGSAACLGRLGELGRAGRRGRAPTWWRGSSTG